MAVDVVKIFSGIRMCQHFLLSAACFVCFQSKANTPIISEPLVGITIVATAIAHQQELIQFQGPAHNNVQNNNNDLFPHAENLPTTRGPLHTSPSDQNLFGKAGRGHMGF